jgi:outer membrane lipoprotein carrier protein
MNTAFKNITLAVLGLGVFVGSQALCKAVESKLLKEVEKKYQSAQAIQMDVVKKLKIQLLDKEKTSYGKIKIARGGKFKWEIEKPEKSSVILTSKEVWVVDYPQDEKEKISVLKSRKPKKSQSPAVITFLMGQGGLSKNFKIQTLEEMSNGDEKIILEAKQSQEPVKKIQLMLNGKDKVISTLEFEDGIGNVTTLEFKNVTINPKFDEKEFIFIPPANADVTLVD